MSTDIKTIKFNETEDDINMISFLTKKLKISRTILAKKMKRMIL